jgi:anaerobic ribonucleoside-triphosphate reductase activating protein
MLKYYNYDIVFQEIPGEVTLALNLSGCPNRCSGCHSPHLQEDTGEELTEIVLATLLEKYGDAVTCVCFMGGDNSPKEVLHLAKFIRQYTFPLCAPCEKPLRLCGKNTFDTTSQQPHKTAWYSGDSKLYENAQHYFDYIKLGQYIEELGGLKSPITNQRFYRIENEIMVDMTHKFYRKM